MEADWGEIRTDLAMEAHELATQRRGGMIPGVTSEDEEKGPARISRVTIQTEEAGRALGKQPGYYVTVEAPALRGRDKDELEEVGKILAEEIQNYLRKRQIAEADSVLVVGLGNWNATPDALGPKVVELVLVTRHLWSISPPEKRGGLRPVCAISPGVLGITGLETGEIVAGIVQKIRPGFLLVIDALASRNVDRLGAVVQLANTGINPGSGIGNQRLGITAATLGVPVIAMGVPTVVDARTIIHDALELTGTGMGMERDFLNIQGKLSPFFRQLIVTPKEIDVLIQDLSRVVAGAINIALHPGVTPEEVFRYLD